MEADCLRRERRPAGENVLDNGVVKEKYDYIYALKCQEISVCMLTLRKKNSKKKTKSGVTGP